MSKTNPISRNGMLKRKEGIDRPYDEVSVKLNAWKNKTGFTQDEIADKSGVALSTIRLVFAGRRAPSFELLRYLRIHHGVNLNTLIAGK